MALDSVPATWTAGEIPTAAKMNTEIRDALAGIQAPWIAYTPTWIGSVTNPVIGNGTIVGKYTRFGKTIHFRLRIVMGSTTNFGTGTSFQLSLPVTSAMSSFDIFGFIGCYDSSGNIRTSRAAVANGAATFLGAGMDLTGAVISPTNPFTWAVGDILAASGTYEAA